MRFNMFRSQIYLTEAERAQLHKLSRQTGKSQSELIREAIDRFVELNLKQSENKLASARAVKGMWRDRDDLPNFTDIRKEFDRDNEE
jgi:predicted DNA-binding protein